MRQAGVELLVAGLAAVGLVGEGEEGERGEGLRLVCRHLELVREGNERVNLTAVCEWREMVIKHAVDSATVLRAVEVRDGDRVLDVGSGAGFPGLTIKLLRPQGRVVLVESSRKKCEFLRQAARELGVGSRELEVVWGRAEDLGRQREYREQFDLVMARAVAELRVLVELCLPFCRVGGVFVALKGPSADEELAIAGRAVEMLGGKVCGVERVVLPEGAGERRLVVIEKVVKTAARFPRRAGLPKEKPL